MQIIVMCHALVIQVTIANIKHVWMLMLLWCAMVMSTHPSPAVADPVVTLTPDVDPLEGNATDNITLTCSWTSTVFYLVWFKDGAPLYSRNLVSGGTVDSTSASVSVEVEGLSSTLTFSQVSDSGSYTCAVTCRSKDSDEEDIPMQFRATKDVLIYGRLE